MSKNVSKFARPVFRPTQNIGRKSCFGMENDTNTKNGF
jgi:hypothetical protein